MIKDAEAHLATQEMSHYMGATDSAKVLNKFVRFDGVKVQGVVTAMCPVLPICDSNQNEIKGSSTPGSSN